MKRLMWMSVLVMAVVAFTVSCATMESPKAKGCGDKSAKAEVKAEKAEKQAEKAEKKAEAKAEKAEKRAEAKAEKAEKKAEAEEAVNLQKVESSLIDSVGYDPATEDLTIVFVGSGDTYVYHKVPEKVYKKLMAADSKGKFFTKNIKEKYEFTKK